MKIESSIYKSFRYIFLYIFDVYIRKFGLFYGLLILIADQFSKQYILNNFIYSIPKYIEINNFLNIVYVRNYGVSFGILSSLSKNYLLLISSTLLFLLLLYQFKIYLTNIIYSQNSISIQNSQNSTSIQNSSKSPIKSHTKLHKSYDKIHAINVIFWGAIGNIIDRYTHGYVIDFIDFHWKKLHYPAFNIADSAVVIGVIIIFICEIRNNLNNSLKNS